MSETPIVTEPVTKEDHGTDDAAVGRWTTSAVRQAMYRAKVS
jgi:hypothetical protein